MTPAEAFVEGVRHTWLGARMLATRRELWPFVIGPVLLLGSLVLGTAVLVWHVAGVLLSAVWQPGEGERWWGLVVSIGFRSACVLVSAALWYLASNLLAVPFLERLSQEVEVIATGRAEEPGSWGLVIGELLVSLSHSLLSFGLWLVVLAACATLNLLPVLGSVVSALAATLATAVWLAREAMDGPMSRRRLGYAAKLRVVANNLPSALGFGLVQSVALWIPFLNLAVLPVSVAGATLLYCRLEEQGLAPGRPRPSDPG